MLSRKISLALCLFIGVLAFSQTEKANHPTLVVEAAEFREVGSLTGRKLIPIEKRKRTVNPKQISGNKVVPGKGLPKGPDPLLSRQKNNQAYRFAQPPSLVFDANSSGASPTDPTGAVGPNHYVSANNSSFAIHDRNGNVLVPPTSLANIWENETKGDPVVLYDNFADRFVITQFDGESNSTNVDNGFLIAVCKGSDPVNDGWFTYRFRTGNTFPDYPKYSIWSDGYYITANKNQGSTTTNEVIYVLERDKLIRGVGNAKMIGFPLPGSVTSGFYSPGAFNAMGTSLPPPGDAKIIYLQDDAWEGVSDDALKLWTVNVNWNNPNTSTIVEDEELTASGGDINSFDSVFDGGNISNLPQPGSGDNLDALQATMMYATNYRRFCDYNSVVLNFAVDIDNRPDTDNVSAIRWFELRQNGDGAPWRVFQEGTYASPNGKSAWSGSMAMDVFGNIGMGYTTMGTTADGATEDSFPSIRYTGRLSDDPLGVMTFAEQNIIIGTSVSGNLRYGDYSHLTLDPVDQKTFWHTAEYFKDFGDRIDVVGVFQIANTVSNDVGVISIDAPVDATQTNSEAVTIIIQNFGTLTQSNIPVSYTVNNGATVDEVFTGSISPGGTGTYTFSALADLTAPFSSEITARTNNASDEVPRNNCTSKTIKNLFPIDVGISGLVSPNTESSFSDTQEITVTIANFGGEPQSNIPVSYSFDGSDPINEIFEGTIPVGESVDYTFSTTEDISGFGSYTFEMSTSLAGDGDTSNDTLIQTLVLEICKPTSNCTAFGDGIVSFRMSNIINDPIACGTGYDDFTDREIILDRTVGNYTVTVQTGFANGDAEQVSLWIDFNDNNTFEDSELLLSNEVIDVMFQDRSFTVFIPGDAPIGSHVLRIRGGDTNTNDREPLNAACGSMQYGTTHDYKVNIAENTNVITDLLILSLPDNQFELSTIDTTLDKKLRISIYNALGQEVVSNLIERDINGKYFYSLNMSYASKGIYFVRLGSKKFGKTGTFAVR